MGGRKAKKNTFGENPKKVASKWSSSYAEMSYPPAKRIVRDIVIPSIMVAAASGRYWHFQTWPVKCWMRRLQQSNAENISKYSETMICSSFQNPFLSQPKISSFSDGLFITGKKNSYNETIWSVKIDYQRSFVFTAAVEFWPLQEAHRVNGGLHSTRHTKW